MQRSDTPRTDERIHRRPDGSIDTRYYMAQGHLARSREAHRLVRGG